MAKKAKITRQPVPYKALSAFDKESQARFKQILEVGLGVIKREIMNSRPHPDENVIRGMAKRRGLKKALPQLDNPVLQPLKDYLRRLKYGAPLTPAQLDSRTQAQLLNRLPFQGGNLWMDRTVVVENQEDVPVYEVVSLSALIGWGLVINQEKFRDVLAGRPQPIVLIAEPDTVTGDSSVLNGVSKAYGIAAGIETLFAARLLWIPAVRAQVYHPETIQLSTTSLAEGPKVTRTEVETIGREITKYQAYKLPSLFEPLAALARKYPKETFAALFNGEDMPEERAATADAEKKELQRAQFWSHTYNLLRSQGVSEDDAIRQVADELEWKRLNEIAEGANADRGEIRVKWGVTRQEFLQAKQEVKTYAQSDGQPVSGGLDTSLFWDEANKGNTSKLST